MWFAICLIAGLAAFGAGIYVVFGSSLLHSVDRALEEEIAEVIVNVERSPADTLRSELDENFAGHAFYSIQVLDPSGRMVFATPESAAPLLTAAEFPPDEDAFIATRPSRAGTANRLRAQRVARTDGEYLVVVGDGLAAYRAARGRLLATLLTLGPAAALLALAGGYWLSRRALAPVDRLTQTALSITGARLNRRVPEPNSNDEVGRLARAFNEMIARLEQSFGEVRRFTADAAHELRTPLAVLRTGAEIALRSNASTEQYRQVLSDQLDEIGRLSRLADQLLFLCREDAGLVVEPVEDVRLDTLLEELCETLQLSAEAKGVVLACGDSPVAIVAAQPDRVRRLMLNLLDNALRHTPTGGRVDVRLSADQEFIAVEIEDTGCGIPPEQLPRVFDRFYRGDVSRGRATGGSGLGLAICRSIVETLDGEISLTSRVGHGTTAVVRLPGRLVGFETPTSPAIRAEARVAAVPLGDR
jgi:heavy metal sensor kinase